MKFKFELKLDKGRRLQIVDLLSSDNDELITVVNIYPIQSNPGRRGDHSSSHENDGVDALALQFQEGSAIRESEGVGFTL